MDRRSVIAYLALGPLAAGVGACAGSSDNRRLNLPTVTDNATVGPGDVFTMEIVGEENLPKQYQIASDGTVDLPYLPALPVGGLEPQEIGRLIRQTLIEKKVLSDPSVIIQVKEYNSRRIAILGQVAAPGTFPFTRGLTLIQAISQAGGLTPIANLDKVNLTRRTKGGSKTVVISMGTIMEGRSADIPLQSGDRIFVHERMF